MIAPSLSRSVRRGGLVAIVLLLGIGVALLLRTDGTRSPDAEDAPPSGRGANDPAPLPGATAAGPTSALAPAPVPVTPSGDAGARVLRLRGRTVRAGRMPAARVSITVDVEGEVLAKAVSGPDGGFVLELAVGAGLARTAARLVADDGIGRQAFRVVYLGAGDAERNLGLLVLEPTTTLDVRVTLPTGSPSGVRVEALQVLVEDAQGRRRYPAWASRASGVTDVDGLVTLSGLGTGRYQVVAGAPGFGRGSANVTLPREGDALQVTLTIERLVTVTVVDAKTGAPIPGAELARLYEVKPLGERSTALVDRRPELQPEATDAVGRTVLGGLSPDESLLVSSVVAPGYVWAEGLRDGADIPPGASALRIAMTPQPPLRWPLDAAVGAPVEDGAPVRIERGPDVLARGQELAPRARVMGSRLVVDGLSQGHLPAIAFLGDGRFAELTPYGDASEGPPLRFRRPFPIQVRLRDGEGAAVPGWMLTLAERVGADIGGVSQAVETDAAGLAVLEVASPGVVRVRGHPAGYPFSSRDLGDVDVRAETSVLDAVIPAELAVDVWVRLGNTPTLPEGLELFVDHDELRIEREDLFAGRVEGRWSKTVGAREATVHVRAPGWLPAAVKVPIPEGTRRVSAVLHLVPAARIVARATPATGFQPRLALERWDPRERDWAAAPAAPWMLGGADPEAPGSSLRLDGLVPGRYRLVDLESGAASAPVEAAAGVETALSLDLSRAGPVRGRVVAEGDADVSQARVHLEGLPAGDFGGLRPGEAQGRPVGKDGTFLVMVPGTGPVRITVSHPSLEPAVDGGSVTVNGARDGVELRLEGAPVLTIPLLLPAGGVVGSFRVHLLDAGEAPTALRARRDGGALVVEGLSPGVHTLLLDVAPWAPVLLRNVLVLGGATSAPPVSLLVGGRLRVRVRRGAGAVVQDVEVVVTGLEAPGYTRTEHGAGDEIVVTGLARGRVKVTVRDSGGSGARLEEFLESDGGGELTLSFEVP